jgi:hypothetical protein
VRVICRNSQELPFNKGHMRDIIVNILAYGSANGTKGLADQRS